MSKFWGAPLYLISRDEEFSGFLARHCLIYGDRVGFANIGYEIPSELKQQWEDIIFRLAEIDLLPDQADDPKIIRLSPEARAIFLDASTRVNFQMVSFQGLKKAFYAKLPEKILRFANILHHLHAAADGTDFLADVSGKTMNDALLLAGWLTEHFELFLARLDAIRHEDTEDPKAHRNSFLGAAYKKVISELRPAIEANDGRVSNDLIKAKVKELTKIEQTDELYNRYMEPYTLCAVSNVRSPLTKKRGRGRILNSSAWEGVSPVSGVSSIIISNSYSDTGGDTPQEGVSPTLLKQISVPSEYRV